MKTLPTAGHRGSQEPMSLPALNLKKVSPNMKILPISQQNGDNPKFLNNYKGHSKVTEVKLNFGQNKKPPGSMLRSVSPRGSLPQPNVAVLPPQELPNSSHDPQHMVRSVKNIMDSKGVKIPNSSAINQRSRQY